MEAVIKASDFAKYLEKRGLVIVSKSQLEQMAKTDIHQKRKDLLRRSTLTLGEILQLELLPIKTRTSLERWIQNGTFLPTEVARNKHNQIIILTSALTRLGYV
jgi:hypothetical protein